MSLLTKLFGPKESFGLTKSDYWIKWELKELITDVEQALTLLSDLEKEKENPHLHYFIESLELDLFDLTHDNNPDFSNVWYWFRTHGDWDQLTQNFNQELRGRIYFRANRWKTEAL